MTMNDFTNVDLLAEITISELKTDEARQGFLHQVEQIKLEMLSRIFNAFNEVKDVESEKIYRDKASRIAMRLDLYRQSGLSEEQAWKLIMTEETGYAGKID